MEINLHSYSKAILFIFDLLLFVYRNRECNIGSDLMAMLAEYSLQTFPVIIIVTPSEICRILHILLSLIQ